jgi:hypothetical protein
MRAARQLRALSRRRLTFWLRRTRDEITQPAFVARLLKRS